VRIALVASPFISVPPSLYGGTELFVAELALGLKARNVDVVVYTNGESTVDVERRWLYERAQWPIKGEVYDNLKDINHSSWAIADAAADCDILHVNNIPALFNTRLAPQPSVYTVHHPHEAELTELYRWLTDVQFVTISDFQRRLEPMANIRTIHHGVNPALYRPQTKKEDYLSFIGRIAPVKGVHLAIEVAHKTGIPLKIAGEVQPRFRDYFDSEIKPHIDGKFIEFVGEANLEQKNELLGHSRAMLFPIQWDEPFGLVMIEAMACGTPVLALPRGSVPEVVKDGVSGWICNSVDELADRAKHLAIAPSTVRAYVEREFGLDRMVSRYVELYTELLEERAIEPPVSDEESALRSKTSTVA
jgi:glycosyltransferase involved in cell wall biosynthesis